jgi:hypothetical protein
MNCSENRKTASSGGNNAGKNLRMATYTANSLNQYSAQTHPGSFDILGDANSSATVSANLARSERKGEYFRVELSADKSGGPVLQSLTHLAVLNNGANADWINTVTGSVYVEPASVSLTYDLDGNLVNDGHLVLHLGRRGSADE